MGVTESLGVSQWFRCLFAMVSLPSKLIEARCGTWNSVSPHGATLRAIGSPAPIHPFDITTPSSTVEVKNARSPTGRYRPN